MSLVGKIISAAALGLALVAVTLVPANAQQISATTMALARQLVHNAPDVGDFDGILPDVMVDTKTRLINLRPDLYKQISVTVEATASSLVARRNDLDNDIATIWAMNFSDDELKQINAFFASPVGQKYKAMAPTVGNAIVAAGQSWANKLSDEMYSDALASLQKQGFQF